MQLIYNSLVINRSYVRIRRYASLIVTCTLVIILLKISINSYLKNISFRSSAVYTDPPVRGVIITLIRSTDHSISLTINMMHSVIYFHRNNGAYTYPFLIFHDKNFTDPMRQKILSCVLRTNKNVKILFAPANLETSVTIHHGMSTHKPIGYRLMCRFWTYDVFYHPAIVEGKYDYIMRMDDDSYFSDVIHHDIFSYVRDQGIDYAYRTTYNERLFPMDRILGRFVNSTFFYFSCIYNNFFVMRLKWFYESQRVQSFIRELIKDDLMLRYYIGDGCAHAGMFEVENKVKVQRLVNIPYGHNYHLLPAGDRQATYKEVKDFYHEIQKSCQQLTVVRTIEGTIIRIKLP